MSNSAHLVAFAARTPVGLTAEGMAAAVRAGICRIAEHPFMVDPDGQPLYCAREPTLSADLLGAARLTELARLAVNDLAEQLAPSAATPATLPIWLALPEERPGFDAQAARALVGALSGATPAGPIADVHALGRGHAGMFLALRDAVARIEQRQLELVVVGGVDGYLEADTLDWLDDNLRLARENRRGGFPPGESAALLVLASAGFCRQSGLPSLGAVRAVACAQETRDENGPEGLLGEALTEVFLRLGASSSTPRERFDDVYCDINDERPRTTDFAFALLRAAELFRDGSAYVTAVEAQGDVGAASPAVNCILAARAWARGYAAGKTALVCGASWTGLRGGALIERPEES